MKIDLNNDIFNIKRIQNIEEYFPNYVNTYLDSYILFLEGNQINCDIIQLIKDFSRNIYICLIEYYCGQHNSAKYYFDKAIRSIHFNDIYEPIDQKSFYRARKSSGTLFTKDEMFHIPLEKRYLVSTQRYSYPGLPCLYLGSSYEVCCDELCDWDDSINIAYIENNTFDKMTILNLCFFEKYDFEKISKEDGTKFFRLWPLIACCSFVYANPDKMRFRPDYIIPQLLLEYIVDQNTDVDMKGYGKKACGIKYHSVKNAFFKKNHVSSMISYNNYVFPVISNQHNGYSNILKEQFDVKWVRFLRELNN